MPKFFQIIHEHSPDGRHRIVVTGDMGPSAGEWVEHHQLATHYDLIGNAGASQVLPLGVFSIRERKYEILSA